MDKQWKEMAHWEKGDDTFFMMLVLTQRKARWHVFHDADISTEKKEMARWEQNFLHNAGLETEKKEMARWEKGDDTFSIMPVLTQRKARWHVFHDADINTEKKEMARRSFRQCWCCSRWTKRKGTAKRRREINDFLPRFEVGIAVVRVRSFHNYYTAELSGKRCCSEFISLSLYFTERLARFKNR